MKKALILGISGQDGAYLAELLLKEGYRVAGASRDAQMSSFRNLVRLGIRDRIEAHSVTLTDFRSVIEVLSRFEPDEVYNLAGQSSVGLSFHQPVETFMSLGVGVMNLLEAIRFLGRPIRLYNASSTECFGDTLDAPANEKTPFSPKSPYAVAKAAAHWLIANYREAYGLFTCSGILSNHESPLRPPRFVTRKIVSTALRIAQGSGETLTLGNIAVSRDFGWAPEYVTAMWRMLQLDAPEDFVIATGQSNTLERFVETAFAELGLDYRGHLTINPEFYRPSDILVSRADPGKALEKLGWRAQYKMADVIRFMLDHEKDANKGVNTP